MNKIYCKHKLTKWSKKKFLFDYFEYGAPATYNKESNTKQCDGNKNRSILDLKMLLDGQFKSETTIDDIIFIMVNLVSSEKLKALYCPNIRKVVFFQNSKDYYYFNGPSFMAAPYKEKVGIDGYSYDQMLEIYKNKTK
jgi:hypothetical protein